MGSEPSKRQKAVLDSIRECIEERGYAPTVRDICKNLGLSSPSTVHVHLKALEEKGLIKRDAHKSRSIILVDPAAEESLPSEQEQDAEEDLSNILAPSFARTIQVPLVGNVAAGVPILAEQNIEDTLSLPTDIVGDAASFMLSVRGDSMVECGINDGDYVVVKQQPNANNGDIVVAIIDDGATVKRFFREKDYIRLQPENSSMEPIITRDCSIAGKVVAVFRRL